MTRPTQNTTRLLLALGLSTLGAATSVAAASPADAVRAAPAPKAGRIVVAANSAADTCAKGLPADSKMIFDATVQNMKGPDSIRDTVTEQTKALVMAGKLNRANARPAAEAAGTCLKLLAKS
jgi:hypothetical protein